MTQVRTWEEMWGEPEKEVGQLQELKDVEEFRKSSAEEEVEVGPGPWVYRRWEGVAKALVPIETPPEGLQVYVEEIDWGLLPPRGELSCLYHSLFKKYDREILVVMGRSRTEDKCLYFVPRQTGTSGGVDWEADEDIDEFNKVARWVGTIHIHPGGMSPDASTVDVEEWAAPEKSGLHIILGRNETFQVYLAVAGRTIHVLTESLKDVRQVKVTVCTSQGKPLEELLRKPKPVETRIPQHYGNIRDTGTTRNVRSKFQDQVRDWEEEQELRYPHHESYADEDDSGYSLSSGLDDLADAGMALMTVEDEVFLSVEQDGLYYVMSDADYQDLRGVMGSECPPAFFLGKIGVGRRVY